MRPRVVVKLDAHGCAVGVELDYDGARTDIPCVGVTVKWTAARRPAAVTLDLSARGVVFEQNGEPVIEAASP